MGKKFLTSSFQMIRFDEKDGFTLLEETRECIFRYRNGLKFAQGILESMILSRPSAVGGICDRMPLHRCFLGLEPLVARGKLPPFANKLAEQAEFFFPKLKQ